MNFFSFLRVFLDLYLQVCLLFYGLFLVLDFPKMKFIIIFGRKSCRLLKTCTSLIKELAQCIAQTTHDM